MTADAVRVTPERVRGQASWGANRWAVMCDAPGPGLGELGSGPAGQGRAERESAGGAEGEPAGFVPAEAARRHLTALGAEGIGLNTVAGLSGVSHGSLSKILYGEPRRGRPPSRRIRRQTAERILAVSVEQASGGQRVDAGPTWALVEELVAAGYTRAELARLLGSTASSPSLQIGRRLVRASTARAVEALHARLLGGSGS